MLQRPDGSGDVVRPNGHVLNPGAAVEIQILLDLRFFLALRGLVDRKLHEVAWIRHHLRAKCRVFGRDVLIVERDELREAKDPAVEIAPGVHLAPTDVADTMIDKREARLLRRREALARFDKAGRENAGIAVALDKRVDGIAIRRDRRSYEPPAVIVEGGRP